MGSGPQSVTVGDLNGDGKLDLAVANLGSSTVSILLNTCLPLAQGELCNGNGDCASGFCVDNVCCNSACGGGVVTDCQACSVAAGAAVDGTCGPVPNATMCRPAFIGSCDVSETCDGSSLTCPANQFAPLGSQPSACSGAHACNGAGTCALAGGQSCSSGSQCASNSCVASTCLLTNGQTCSTSSQCASGSCVGGTCGAVGVPTLSGWGIIVFSCLALGFVLWQTRGRLGAS